LLSDGLDPLATGGDSIGLACPVFRTSALSRVHATIEHLELHISDDERCFGSVPVRKWAHVTGTTRHPSVGCQITEP
jgi:hypothetical protein